VAAIVPVLQQLVQVITQLVTALQAQMPQAQAQAGAAAVQGGGNAVAGDSGDGLVEGGGGMPPQKGGVDAGAAPACSCSASMAAGAADGVQQAQQVQQVQQVEQSASDTDADAKGSLPEAPPLPGTTGSNDLPDKKTKDRKQIKSFIKTAAKAYGADPGVLSKIAKLESGFNWNSVNNWDSNAQKGTPSKGMFQFIEPTFKSYAKDAKAANPKAWEGLGKLDWMDWRQQALTTAWAIENGHGQAWATFNRAGG
jgi:hypothetical protein